MGMQTSFNSSDGFELTAYRADPEGKPIGGIVLIQEIFGVNSHIRSVADDYAKQGFRVVAPAIFDRQQRGVDAGYGQSDIEAGIKFATALDFGAALKDVGAAAGEARVGNNVALVGYCLGGTLAWLGAASLDGITCAVAYYGGSVPKQVDKKPKCPILLHWGDQDTNIPQTEVAKVEAAHPEAISYHYPAGHGFNCDQRGSFHAESAALARERTIAFLRKHFA